MLLGYLVKRCVQLEHPNMVCIYMVIIGTFGSEHTNNIIVRVEGLKAYLD